MQLISYGLCPQAVHLTGEEVDNFHLRQWLLANEATSSRRTTTSQNKVTKKGEGGRWGGGGSKLREDSSQDAQSAATSARAWPLHVQRFSPLTLPNLKIALASIKACPPAIIWLEDRHHRARQQGCHSKRSAATGWERETRCGIRVLLWSGVRKQKCFSIYSDWKANRNIVQSVRQKQREADKSEK